MSGVRSSPSRLRERGVNLPGRAQTRRRTGGTGWRMECPGQRGPPMQLAWVTTSPRRKGPSLASACRRVGRRGKMVGERREEGKRGGGGRGRGLFVSFLLTPVISSDASTFSSCALMSSLSYFIIYNSDLPLEPPSAQPGAPAPPEDGERDEDAQEAAHIVFYSSTKNVTSRDKMLRHLGLAKGLENFAR